MLASLKNRSQLTGTKYSKKDVNNLGSGYFSDALNASNADRSYDLSLASQTLAEKSQAAQEAQNAAQLALSGKQFDIQQAQNKEQFDISQATSTDQFAKSLAEQKRIADEQANAQDSSSTLQDVGTGLSTAMTGAQLYKMAGGKYPWEDKGLVNPDAAQGGGIERVYSDQIGGPTEKQAAATNPAPTVQAFPAPVVVPQTGYEQIMTPRSGIEPTATTGDPWGASAEDLAMRKMTLPKDTSVFATDAPTPGTATETGSLGTSTIGAGGADIGGGMTDATGNVIGSAEEGFGQVAGSGGSLLTAAKGAAGGIAGGILGKVAGDKGWLPGMDAEMGAMAGTMVAGGGPYAVLATMAPRAIDAVVKIGEKTGQQLMEQVPNVISKAGGQLGSMFGGGVQNMGKYGIYGDQAGVDAANARMAIDEAAKKAEQDRINRQYWDENFGPGWTPAGASNTFSFGF
jgi:hypothetical protein